MRSLLALTLAISLVQAAVINPVDASVTWYEVMVRNREIVWGVASDDGLALVAIGDPRAGIYPNVTHIRYHTPAVVSLRPIPVEEIERINASIKQNNVQIEAERARSMEAYRQASAQREREREYALKAIADAPTPAPVSAPPLAAPTAGGGVPLIAGNGDVRGMDNDGDGRPEPNFVRAGIDGRRSHFRAIAIRQGASLTLSKMPMSSGLIQTLDGAVFECGLLSKYDVMLWMPGDNILVTDTFALPSGGTCVVLKNLSDRSTLARSVTTIRLR